ncbi:MAG: AAA family ATPase, partial [Bacteroidota bacterium]|nr:AAA family ATPase [Bacteroidota bacterium]
ENLHHLTERLQQTITEMETAEKANKTAEEEYRTVATHYNELNLQLMRQQSKLQTAKQELVYKQNQLAQLQAHIESNTKQLSESSFVIEESNAAINETEILLQQLQVDKSESEQKVNAANKEYYGLRNALAERESAIRLKVKSREFADQIINEIKDKTNELKLQLAGMKERLHVEFKIVLDDIIDELRTTTISLQDLQATSDKMKKRLENIGEINPTAIEAFTEMKKRYEFILEQKNDLVTAKKSLLQTIDEVEATANQQFLDTFNKVRDNFQRVFKALFTEEDTADLILENPNDLAETSIDIVAKPKGKRPSSISQLSGGEKTLTATALLFAIYLIKPAPFCILDEVDAPLDDANVGKFTNMIKQFSDNSQFIIVTHNKTTMSTVDVIYGVTMQEPGVSKLVPVDFRNLN